MKHIFQTLLLLFYSMIVFGQLAPSKELELISMHTLEAYPYRFDFSGLTRYYDDYLVVADKTWNQYAYKIKIDSLHWYLTDSIQLGLSNNSDLEGIDFCQESGLYFIDEKFNRAYLMDASGKSHMIFNKGQLRDGLKWGTNSGLEGVAVDCENNILYLAKERDPRFIVTFDLGEQMITDIFDLPDSESDISDLKFENGFLYMLERNANYVTKINVQTKQLIARVSYGETCSHADGKLYSYSDYGLAEALLLNKDEIWIGLDNNGLPFSEHALKTYGLRGNQPLLIKFKRPQGF